MSSTIELNQESKVDLNGSKQLHGLRSKDPTAHQKFQLSPEDKIEYENIYALLAGGEKNISAKDIGRVMAKLGIHCSKEELDDMIDVVDKDGYGLVHKKHFMNLMTQKVKETSHGSDGEVYEDAFKIFDQSKVGKLTMSDIRNIMLNIGEKLCDSEIQEMLGAVNMDTSGISYEDFMTLVTEKSSL